MTALIIYVHPNTKGHNSYTLKEVKKELDRRSEKYEVIDLYNEDYDPY